REPEDVGEEPLGEPVAAHDPLGDLEPRVGQADRGALDRDQTLLFEATDHLRHGRARDLDALRDPGLDDLDVVLVQLPDGLAVLLEGRVELPRSEEHTLNSSHVKISYAVFCLKKKTQTNCEKKSYTRHLP